MSGFRDATIDDGAVLGVRRVIAIRDSSRIKARVVTLAYDDDRHPRETLLGVGGGINLGTGGAKQRKLVPDDFSVLGLGNSVPINEDVLGEGPIPSAPELKATSEEDVELRNHLFSR